MSQSAGGTKASAKSLKLNRLMLIIVALAILVPIALLGWGYFDIPSKLMELGRPALVKGSGVVMFAGRPLELGTLETEHENPKLSGAVGYMDAEGRFNLRTDIDGNLVDGAYPGTHKVIIFRMDPTSRPGPGGAPPRMTPDEYGSYETSTLELKVDRDPSKNVYEFTLKGEPKYVNPAALAKPEDAQAANTASAAPPEPDPQQVAGLVERTIQRYDENSNGKLEAAEVETIEGFFRLALQAHDTNKDGEFDRDEIETAAKKFMASMPPLIGAGGGGGPKPAAKDGAKPVVPAPEKPGDAPAKSPNDS